MARKSFKIEDIAEKVGIGPFGSSIKVETFVDKGIPIISGVHLKKNRLEDGNFNFVTEEHANKLMSANVKRGDVIFTHAGNIKSVAYIPDNSKYERYILSQRQFYLRCDKSKLLPEYITYYFKTPLGQKQLLANTSSVGVPSIARPVSYLRSIEIEIPEIFEQEKIVEVLVSIDNKIEINSQMNETLEIIAQSIFREWFVNFNFPDKRGDFENGLPMGWSKGKLKDDFNLVMGQSPSGESFNEIGEGIIFFQGRTDFGFRFPENRIYTTEPNRLAYKFDTLISVRAPVGDINMANETCCIGRGLSAVRHRSGAYSYTYYSMKNIQKYFQSFESEGTVFGSINRANFENLEIIIPKIDIINKFENIVNGIDEKILSNTLEINFLTQIRDNILPKIMNGTIKVK